MNLQKNLIKCFGALTFISVVLYLIGFYCYQWPKSITDFMIGCQASFLTAFLTALFYFLSERQKVSIDIYADAVTAHNNIANFVNHFNLIYTATQNSIEIALKADSLKDDLDSLYKSIIKTGYKAYYRKKSEYIKTVDALLSCPRFLYQSQC